MRTIQQPISLNALPQGACAIIKDVQAGPFDAERLKAMGLCEGRHVTVLKPGQPMIIAVMGVRIGLDRNLARFIDLAPVEHPQPCCMDPLDAINEEASA
ncbi:FeoA family protein [Mucisphaera calidilacus]|uniref:FeoA family protein n=1 Tax=Mucisphaera calidilacus TaxID=2527982 RepID=UPI001F369432|nr:FeoA family protein [Mucisphaera calidilacus]